MRTRSRSLTEAGPRGNRTVVIEVAGRLGGEARVLSTQRGSAAPEGRPCGLGQGRFWALATRNEEAAR